MKLFNLPDLGEGLPDAEIVRWLVSEGDEVSLDQPMVEMETAKAVVEVPSPFAGRISRLCGNSGDVILVGAVLVEFDGESAAQAIKPEKDVPAVDVAKSSSAVTISKSSSVSGQVFNLPDLGEGLPDAEIVRWLVTEGDLLALDQPMVEMETAKAVVEVPSPVAGRVAHLHGSAGEVILVGAPLVSFVAEGDEQGISQQAVEAQPEDEKSGDAGTVVGAVQVGHQVVVETANAVVKALAKKLKIDLSQLVGTGAEGKITQADVKLAKQKGVAKFGTNGDAIVGSLSRTPVKLNTREQQDNPLDFKASPAVRAYARRLEVALSQCQPSGKKGSISKADVDLALTNAGSRTPTNVADSTTRIGGLPSVNVSVSPQPIRGVRRAMAMGMAKSHATVVPTTLMEDADITAWNKQDSLVRYVRALVVAAKREPSLNAWFDGDKFERLLHPNVHVGIAVDAPEGLYVPVVFDAEHKDPSQIRARVQELREKIETRSLKQEDQQGGTITLSNFGSIAGRYGTPVISPPQVAILGTGRFRDELKLTDNGIAKHKMLPLSLTFDHRACTGGEAARFLAAVIEDLQKAS